MKNKKQSKFFYGMIAIIVLIIMVIGTTYAYWVATTSSRNNSIQTKSTIYTMSLDILPLYHENSFIPMNDQDAIKALTKGCRDKYGRGACSAYQINVHDYNEDITGITGTMDVNTQNMTNLSYMVLSPNDIYSEDSCVMIEEESYCIIKEATRVEDGKELSLVNNYDVSKVKNIKLILMIWITNLSYSQNREDSGGFDAIVTMKTDNGGEIKGSIANAVKLESEKLEG